MNESLLSDNRLAVVTWLKRWSALTAGRWLKRFTAGVAGLCLALSLCNHVAGKDAAGSTEWVAALILLTMLAVPLVHVTLFRFALPRLGSYPRRVKIRLALTTLLAGALLSVAIPLSDLPWQIPEQEWLLLSKGDAALLLADIISVGFLLFVAASWLLGRQAAPPSPLRLSRWAWLRYALPGILVWTVYWVAFYPALMSLDSIDQWAQAIGIYQLNVPQPVFYTLILRVVSWLWQSPAAVALLQILVMAVLLAYGLRVLEEAGISPRINTLLAVLGAVAPFNATMVDTIWRDIPYSFCILGLTILLMKSALKPEIENRMRTWILVGVLCALVGFLRNNGPHVVLVLLVVLALFRKSRLGQTLQSRHTPHAVLYPAVATGVFFALYLFTQGPIYDSLHVVRYKWSSTTIWLHAIGAHIASGTPLLQDETTLLNALSPLDQKWHYSETSVLLMLDPAWFDREVLEQNADKIFPVWLALTLRNPIVTMKDVYWSSMLVWVITQPPKGWLGATPVQGDLIPANDLGLISSPPFPALTAGLTQFVRDSLDNFLFLWRPAIYLYLGLAAVAVGAVRSRNAAWLMAGAPVAVQSLLMLVSSINAEERYMYPVQLAFFLLVGLAFLPRRIEGPGQGEHAEP
jgi:hypothetical protein